MGIFRYLWLASLILEPVVRPFLAWKLGDGLLGGLIVLFFRRSLRRHRGCWERTYNFINKMKLNHVLSIFSTNFLI